MADDKKPIPLEELYAEYNAMRGELLGLAEMLPDGDDFKTTIIDGDKKITDLIAEREAKVKECHPSGECWPPHPDCPLCQKVAAMWDKKAREKCKELGLTETEENLEIALREYLKSKAPKL